MSCFVVTAIIGLAVLCAAVVVSVCPVAPWIAAAVMRRAHDHVAAGGVMRRSALIVLVGSLALVDAHMGAWHESAFGWNSNNYLQLPQQNNPCGARRGGVARLTLADLYWCP